MDNTNIPKAVYDNIRDRRPQSEPDVVDLISEDPQTPTDREPDPALVEKIKEQASKQAELEMATLKKQMAEAHARQEAELYILKRANEEAEAKMKKLKEAERKATEEASRQKKEADKALALAAAKRLAETVDVAAQQQRAESEVRSTTDAKYREALEQARALRLEVLVNDLDQLRENAGVPDKVRAQLEKEDAERYFSPPALPKYIKDGFPEDRKDPENEENWTFALDQYRKQNLGYVKDRMQELNRLKAQGKPIKSFKDRYFLTVYWEEVEYRMNQYIRKAQEDLGDYFLPPHLRESRKLVVTAKLKELAEVHMQPTAPRGEASGAASVMSSEASSMLPSRRAVPRIEGFRHKLPIPLSKDPAESSLTGLDEEISKALKEKFGETTPASSRLGMFIASSTPEEDLEAAKFGMQPRATYLMPDTNLKLPVTSKAQGCDIPTVEEYVASYTNPNAPISESVTIDPTYCGHCGSVDGTHCDCSKHQCVYPPCEDFKKHSIYLCPTLMSRCGRCMLRGHTEVMCLRYTLHQWIYVYNCYLHMNILTHDVVNNIAMTVYPFPSTIPSNVIAGLSIVISRTRFFALASRKSLSWAEDEFIKSLKVCGRSTSLEPFIAQAITDLKAGFRHVRDLQREEEDMVSAWELQVQRTTGRFTPFCRPKEWNQFQYFRWFQRLYYCLMCYGMPNYRGFDLDELVLELGNKLAILPRGPDGRVYDGGDKYKTLLENNPPQYLVRKVFFHRLTQASIKKRMTEVNSRVPSVAVGAIPSIRVNTILKAYQNFDASKEHLHAPIHALDRVYAQLRESVPAVNETLHPQIKGALIVDIHEPRYIPPRSGSEKRVRDSSVGSSETAKKKGKTGTTSQGNTPKTSQSRGRSTSRGRSGTSRPGGSGGGGNTRGQGNRSGGQILATTVLLHILPPAGVEVGEGPLDLEWVKVAFFGRDFNPSPKVLES